jgi:dTDP-4-amino-4,6-dideoxygalactose transaminase
MTTIRCNQPFLHNSDVEMATAAMRSGKLAMGPYVEWLEANMRLLMNRDFAIGFSSATSAFDAYFEFILSPGDEVIISPFTFHSVIYSILRAGGVPVFIDINNDFLADWSYLPDLVSEKTKAIVVTHIFGKPDLGLFDVLSYRDMGIRVIEDCAQSLGGRYYGGYIGDSLSDAAIFSFYATKNVTAAEGGVLVTNDRRTMRAMRNLRNNGIVLVDDRKVFGTNRRMSDIHAAIGIENLDRIDDITIMRNYESVIYDELLGFETHGMEPGCVHARHHYTILVDKDERYRIYNECIKSNIDLGMYYRYLSNQDDLVSPHCKNTDTPKCNLLSRQMMQLPLGELVSYWDQEMVVSVLREVYDGPIYAA